MIFIYDVLYIKELDNINDIFENESRIPFFLKYFIYLFKKLFCILTIKNNKICVLPYKRINNKLIVSVITKIVTKTTKIVVLSNYLNDVEELNKQLYNNKIHICKGNILPYYLIYNFVGYICNIRNSFSRNIYISK